MASEGSVGEPRVAAAGGGGDDAGAEGGDRLKQRWGDKVYTRRSKKPKTMISSAAAGTKDGDGVFLGAPSSHLGSTGAESSKEMVAPAVVADGDGQPAAKEGGAVLDLSTYNVNSDLQVPLQRHITTTRCVESTTADCPLLETPASSAQELLNLAGDHGIDKLVGKDRLEFLSKSDQVIRDLKGKFENDLQMVRGVMRRVGLENQLFPCKVPIDDTRRRDFAVPLQLRRNVVSLSPLVYAQRMQSLRPLNQLSVDVMGHSICLPEITEKRTPKANQFYRNSEFILANDKFPPSESNRKSKSGVKKSRGSVIEFRLGSKTFKSCSALLERLLKHNFGHIFNSPVDVKGLGLHDYLTIIKQPMDLGTVRDRLNSNYYKVPRDFAEQVRLTFYNAMTYNPEGHEVHTIAKMLLKIFEDRWAAIEIEYLRALKFAYSNDIRTPTSARSTPLAPSLLSPFGGRFLSRSQSMAYPVEYWSETMNLTPSGRIRVPKKPKARDPNKRDMTYAEKQKLSSRLQSLPLEKLDGIIRIIKRKNSLLSHQGDEIEVDIDAVDTETLWELDRFITNHRKNLSKIKRRKERAAQFGGEANVIVPRNIMATEPAGLEATRGAAVVGTPGETRRDARIVPSSNVAPPPSVPENHKSSSSSTSSSDTGSSSSSGSDSESSPDGFDAKHSPAS